MGKIIACAQQMAIYPSGKPMCKTFQLVENQINAILNIHININII